MGKAGAADPEHVASDRQARFGDPDEIVFRHCVADGDPVTPELLHKVERADLRPIMLRRLTVTGSTMRPRTTAEKGAIAAALRERVWPLLDEGRCAPPIHRVFPLAEAASAHALMESSAHVGKIVLKVAD